jgi:hypothetical protein
LAEAAAEVSVLESADAAELYAGVSPKEGASPNAGVELSADAPVSPVFSKGFVKLLLSIIFYPFRESFAGIFIL